MTLEHDGLMPAPPRPAGIDLVSTGKCPTAGMTPMACMLCPYGHMLECHYPYTCEEAECHHYQQEMEAEQGMYPYPDPEVPS